MPKLLVSSHFIRVIALKWRCYPSFFLCCGQTNKEERRETVNEIKIAAIQDEEKRAIAMHSILLYSTMLKMHIDL